MAGPLTEGEVIVTLSCSDPSTITFPQRRLLLTNQKRAVSIGRASRRSSTLEARMYNGWIDAPVMSRQHAELKLDSQSQTVFLRDLGSLHGTYHNDIRLREGQSQALTEGDLVKFGICIDRGKETFPQCVMKVGLKFGEIEAVEGPVILEPKPTVFQVPDDSDSDFDDSESFAAFSSVDGDDEDPDTQHAIFMSSAAALKDNGLEAAPMHFNMSDPIDLTSEPDLEPEENPADSSPVSDDSHADYTLGTVEVDVELAQEFDEPEMSIANNMLASEPDDGEKALDVADSFISTGPLSPFIDTPTPVRQADMYDLNEKANSYIETLQERTHPTEAAVEPVEESAAVEPVEESAAVEVAEPSDEVVVNDAETPAPVEQTARKRKADEISTLVEAELPTEQIPEQIPEQITTSTDTDAKTFKRLRTAAEFLGFFAIGGATVMGALIATAPTF